MFAAPRRRATSTRSRCRSPSAATPTLVRWPERQARERAHDGEPHADAEQQEDAEHEEPRQQRDDSGGLSEGEPACDGERAQKSATLS